MPNIDNPFAFEFDIEGSAALKNALSSAEKSYIRFSDSIDKVTDSLDTEGKAHEESVRKLTRVERIRKGISERIKRLSSGIFSHLKKEVDATGISRGFSKLTSLISGGTIIGALKSAAENYNQFSYQSRMLTTSMADQPNVMAAASRGAVELTGYLNYTRQELIEVSRQMGDFKLVTGDTTESVKRFTETRMDILNLARSMDVGASSVVDLYEDFDRVYKLPHHRLKGIASSMKYIQEQTSITGDELISFGKSLADTLSRMQLSTKEGAADTTRDMMALVAGLKDAGVDAAQALPTIFSEALKIGSEQGNQWLSFIQQNTGIAMEDIRSMIEKGDVVTPMTLFIRSLKKQGPEMLKLNESYFTDMTGMSFASLKNLMSMNEKGLIDTIEGAKKAEDLRNLHEKRALQRQEKLTRIWNGLKRKFEFIWLKIGETVIKAVTKIVEGIDWNKITSGIDTLASKIVALASDGTLSDWFTKIGRVLNFVITSIDYAIKSWNGLTDSTKTFLTYGAGITALLAGLVPVLGVLLTSVTGVAAGLAAVAVGANKIADFVDERQTKSIKGAAKVKETIHGIDIAMKGSEAERIGFIKGEMFGAEARKGKSLITTEGKVNTVEIQRRLAESGLSDIEKRHLEKTWKSYLDIILMGTDLSKVEESRKRELELLKGKPEEIKPAIAKPVTPTPPSNILPSTISAIVPIAQPKTDKIVAIQSQTTDSLLTDIRDILKSSKITPGATNQHPGRTQLYNSLGM